MQIQLIPEVKAAAKWWAAPLIKLIPIHSVMAFEINLYNVLLHKVHACNWNSSCRCGQAEKSEDSISRQIIIDEQGLGNALSAALQMSGIEVKRYECWPEKCVMHIDPGWVTVVQPAPVSGLITSITDMVNMLGLSGSPSVSAHTCEIVYEKSDDSFSQN